MKKILSLFTAAAMSLTLAACGTEPNTKKDKLQVYTSFYAMYDFAREICGDKADIYNMCPPGSEPHDFEPTAQDMARLTKADVFIYNGMGMESWTDSVISMLDGTDVIVVEASDIEKKPEGDPHLWLNPSNAAMEMKNIANACINADPDNIDYYRDRLNTALDKTDMLIRDFTEALKGVSSDSIVVSHDAYQSLCDAFSLTQYPINGKDNEEDPTPKRIAAIESYIADNNIRCIFTEPLGTSTVVATIAADTGCELLTLDPFEGNLNDEDYFTVMYSNLEALKKALE
ncbi:MAG: zinc ABC transporter substrate-binding protein [Clostridiales bacterium]|nr:zinc ABC transporter substrate-binding protein [Clostridiales bacterium]